MRSSPRRPAERRAHHLAGEDARHPAWTTKPGLGTDVPGRQPPRSFTRRQNPAPSRRLPCQIIVSHAASHAFPFGRAHWHGHSSRLPRARFRLFFPSPAGRLAAHRQASSRSPSLSPPGVRGATPPPKEALQRPKPVTLAPPARTGCAPAALHRRGARHRPRTVIGPRGNHAPARRHRLEKREVAGEETTASHLDHRTRCGDRC
jgi:hypothetical protein